MINQLNYIILPFLLLTGVLFIPGALISFVLDRKASLLKHLAIAPAFSVTIITVATFIMHFLPFSWGLPAYFLLSAITVAGVWLLKSAWQVLSSSSKQPASGNTLGAGPRVFVPNRYALFTLFAWLVTIAALLIRVDFNRVIQGGDSNYHYNQLLLISQTGNINPLNANAGLGGLDPAGWFYPTTWHAFVNLGTATGAENINAVAAYLLLMPLVWLLGVSALTVNISREKQHWMWAGVAALFIPLATIRLELNTTLWPFYTAFMLVPGLIAYTLETIPAGSFLTGELSLWQWIRFYAGRFGVALVALIGLFGMHPSVILVPGVGLTFVLAVALWQRGVNDLRKRQLLPGILHTLLGVFLLCAFAAAVYLPGPHQSQLHRYPDVGWGNPPAKLLVSVGAFLPAPYQTGTALTFAVIAGLCIGAFFQLRKQRFLLLAAVVSQWLILIGCYFPIPVFSKITSFYYNVPDRAKVAYAIYLIPLIAIALAELWKLLPAKLQQWQPAVVVCLTLVLGGVIYPGVSKDISESYYPERGSIRFLADENELAMIERTAQTLTADDLVIGDPAAGASLVYTLSGRNSVWKYPAVTQDKEDDWYLVRNFYNYKNDPHVCELVRKYHITHFYKDVSGFFNGSYTWKLRPGMYGVDTNNDGFELVDTGSTAQLFKITYCDTQP